MKKTFIFLALLITGLSSSAQTRTSLYEEFTSENDVIWMPGDPILNSLLSSNSTNIIPIKWMIPLPSAPTPTWSLYQSNKAEINWRYLSSSGSTLAAGPSTMGFGYPSQNTSTNVITNGVNTIPTGRIDGQHQWVFGATNDHPSALNNAVIITAQTQTTNFRVAMNPNWSPTFTSCAVSVTVVSTTSFTALGALMFRLCLVERVINFSTPPGFNGQTKFCDAVRRSYPTTVVGGSVTSMGTNLPGIWIPNQAVTFTVNCNIPASIKDLSQMDFVGFVQDDGDRKIYQAARTGQPIIPNDVKAAAIDIPLSCTNSFTPDLLVQNLGSVPVTALTIAPYVDGFAKAIYNYTGSITSGSFATITLPSYTATYGGHTFSANITGVSGGDLNMINNTAKSVFGISSVFTTSVVESFSGAFPPLNWYVQNYDFTTPSWGYGSPGGFGIGTGSAKYDFYNNLNLGDTDDLIFPALNLTSVSSPALTFDVAYAQNNAENDKLEVLVSTNCGATWTTVYSMQGSLLSTAPSYSAGAFIPTSTQWRKETVGLSLLANQPSVLVKFVATADWGNNLYIDNVNLSQNASASIEKNSSNGLKCIIFPNPSSRSAILSVNIHESETAVISVFNNLGELIYSSNTIFNPGVNNIFLNTENWAEGIYSVTVRSAIGTANNKLIITR